MELHGQKPLLLGLELQRSFRISVRGFTEKAIGGRTGTPLAVGTWLAFGSGWMLEKVQKMDLGALEVPNPSSDRRCIGSTPLGRCPAIMNTTCCSCPTFRNFPLLACAAGFLVGMRNWICCKAAAGFGFGCATRYAARV